MVFINFDQFIRSSAAVSLLIMGQDFSSIVHNEDLADFTRGGFSDKQRDAIK